ncbi:MAG: hypothetical protein IIY51_06125 [Erysipelotrichaceae bacterium]|jgi:hypothetical protein|nr:hypothetical protein [Erysipelotrichaceae bacterium]MBQ1304455.1 hypothetical protein [Erysipelotrichaceae bacterium]MBR2599399.1 hypothetical protein [Erysipelotrichaceae bacterium]MBR2791358.1 hypothetical protein [Erysipelotrichaceae bacterium]MBR2826376.1 hypothetical protein [Erysipelotrichaceae bacterium]
MMISPETFRKQNINLSLEELYKVRRELMEDMIYYEDHPDEEEFMLPSRETVYMVNNLYLMEICKLIEEKLKEISE